MAVATHSTGGEAVSHLQRIQSDAHQTITDLAQAEAQGKGKKGDGERLAEALARTGKTINDYNQIVGVVRRADELRTLAQGMDKAGAELAKARRELDAHDAETKAIIADRKQMRGELADAIGPVSSVLSAAQKAACELDGLTVAHADILQHDCQCLDAVTPRDHSSAINIADPDAPYVYVSTHRLRREQVRRFQIMEAARADARAAHVTAINDWTDKQPKNRAGEVVSGKPAPQYADPKWADIVASGFAKRFPREAVA